MEVRKTWSAARDHCVDTGGKLFSDVDGTKEQFGFLLAKMDGKNHWLGIYTEDQVTWRDIDRKVFDYSNLVWGLGKPLNVYNNHVAALNAHNGLCGYTGSCQLSFVCNMMN